MQLPPIAHGESELAEHWLKTSIFHRQARATNLSELYFWQARNNNISALLREQFNVSETIAPILNQLAYFSTLSERTGGRGIVTVVDTSSLEAPLTGSRSSPVNEAHAEIVAAEVSQALTRASVEENLIGVLTPFNGQRRKPMMILGIIIFTISWVLLGAIHPAPQIGWTSVLLFLGCFGMIMTDVMADCLVVEKVALETEDEVGKLQTQVWFLRFTGSFLGMATGGLLLQFSKMSEQNIFFMQGLTQLLIVLPLVLMLEDPPVQVQSVAKQLSDIWVTIKDRRVSYLIQSYDYCTQ